MSTDENWGFAGVQENRFIGSLTGLRYVAAVVVAVGHGSLALRHDWVAQLVAQISSIGMTLFFVLSGFVLWLNYATSFRSKAFSVALREFAIARFARLYPMYGIVVLAAVAWLVFGRGAAAPSLGFILTMTQAWFPVLDGTMLVAVVPQLQHLWSISAELFFYLLFPLVWLLSKGLARVRTVVGLAVANLAVFAILIWVFFQYGASFLQAFVPSLTENSMQWLTYYAPYLHISQFLAGCCVAMAYMKLATRPIGRSEERGVLLLFWMSTAGLAMSPVALFFQPMLPAYYFSIDLAVRLGEVVFFSVVLLAVSRYGRARFLSSRWMIIGGECSYSVYLLHPFLIRIAMIGKSETPALPEFALRLCLFVGVVTALAWVTYSMVEAPSRAWIRRVLGSAAPREILRTT